MPLTLLSTTGGHLVLPDRASLLLSAPDGGNLVVLPPRAVWERSELSAGELARWTWLVAACGQAMLEALPQLKDGCINYWEAGNWALNDAAPPAGRKRAREHRSMHLHLLGRSPRATDPAWRWGESPRFPGYAERDAWAAAHERLSAKDCCAIVALADPLLRERYGVAGSEIAARGVCERCRYPFVSTDGALALHCMECRDTA